MVRQVLRCGHEIAPPPSNQSIDPAARAAPGPARKTQYFRDFLGRGDPLDDLGCVDSLLDRLVSIIGNAPGTGRHGGVDAAETGSANPDTALAELDCQRACHVLHRRFDAP
jgi:hypothetical protein